jgi:hypothetical protein
MEAGVEGMNDLHHDVVRKVLRRHILSASLSSFAWGCVLMVGSFLLLIFTAGLAYIVLPGGVATALAIVVALFVVNVFLDDKEHQDLSVWTADASTTSVARFFHLVFEPLCLGPKTFAKGAELLAKSVRLLRVRSDECARVVLLLLQRNRRVPLDEVVAVAVAPDIVRTVAELQDIDGIKFTTTSPACVWLSEEFITEFPAAVRPVANSNPTDVIWVDPTQTVSIVYEREALWTAILRESAPMLLWRLVDLFIMVTARFAGGAFLGIIAYYYAIIFHRHHYYAGSWHTLNPADKVWQLPLCMVTCGLICALTTHDPWMRQLVPKAGPRANRRAL